MKATAPTLRWRNFARAEATRAWVEATKRQTLNTDGDDSLSDTNNLDSLSDDNSLDSDSDAGRQPTTTGTRARVTRRSLEQRQFSNTSDDDSVDSADSSADEARPLPTSTTARRPKPSSKTRARLAAKHRRALDARQALDSDSADSVDDSLDSGAESSADEAKPLGRPARTQKRHARRTIDARQALDSLAFKDRNRLTCGQRQQTAAPRPSITARQNNLQNPNTSDDNSLSSLSDNSSLDSNSLYSASDSDAARPLPTSNPPNRTSKAPKRLGAGAGTSSRPARISRREILGKHHDLVASAEAAAAAAAPTSAITQPELTNAPTDESAEHAEEVEDDAASVSSVSSAESDHEKKTDEKKEEKKEKTKTSTVTAAPPTATTTGGAAATTTTVGGTSATATITSRPSATSEPEEALAPINSGDATALPNLTLAPGATSTATPSIVVGAINDKPQADTQGRQTLVPAAKKMSAGATAGIVIGVLGFIALLAGAFFLFMRWRRRRRQSSLFGPKTPPLADEKGGGGGTVPPPTYPSWPNQNPNQGQGQINTQRDPTNNKTNSEIINDMIRAAYAAEGEGGNTMADAHADHYLDEKAYAMLAGHPPTPSVPEKKRGVSKWLADVMTPRRSTMSMAQRWPYPVDPPESTPAMPGNGTTSSTTKQKRLTPPRLPLKPVVPPSMLRPGAGPVGGTGLPPGSNVNPRLTVATQTTNTTSSTARWG